EVIEEQLKPEADFKFWIDAREVIMNKVGELNFADDFLKRWLLATGEAKTQESVEAEYPSMVKELSWHLVKEAIAKANGVKVEEADLNAAAEAQVKMQFAQYGMPEVPADILKDYVAHMLKDEKSRRSLIDRAVEDKVRSTVKGLVSLNEKNISLEDFQKMFEAQA
ncbi:MAG: trigger factor, partial [Bacteroidales bacterium]